MDHKTQKMPSRLLCLCLVAVMLLAMVPANVLQVDAVSAGQILYFKPNSYWKQSNARFAAYFFEGSSGVQWVSMTQSSEAGVYQCKIPNGGYTKVIFARMNPGTTSNNFDNGVKWNQTGDLMIPTDSKDYYVYPENVWDNGNGTWNTRTDFYLIGNINGSNYSGTNYHIDDGSLTVTFTKASYVYVKEKTSGKEFMTDGWLGVSATSATLYDKDKISGDNKLYVPANVEVTFTLTENSNGTLTLSYTTSGSTTPTTTPTTPTTTPTTPPSGNRTIYYDATLSKLSYNGTWDTGTQTIPVANGNNVGTKIFCHYWTEGGQGKSVTMTKLAAKTVGSNTYADVWSASIPWSATHVIFYSSNDINTWPADNSSSRTGNLKLDANPNNNCFYADSSDLVLYDGGTRAGYWGEVYNIRSAEFMKGNDIVEIDKLAFKAEENTLYLGTTFYDYYTDYELNGSNRDDHPYHSVDASTHRYWVPFRHFNQALSSYYSQKQANVPIYTGHFQPDDWSPKFADIQATLGLYGYNSSNENAFMSVNNSYFDLKGNGNKINAAAQGIVHSELSPDKSLLIDLSSGTAAMPYFDEAFINGTNSKNTKLGEVYKNVKFPFTKNNKGYWVFDSSKTTLQMKQDETGAYYLKTITDDNQKNYFKNTESNGGIKSTLGFFPFNSSKCDSTARYNYGYGARIDVKFNLTPDGKIELANGQKQDIIFKFSGDDDVWVFIDGQLALDIGGAHGRVEGTINFAGTSQTKSATVSAVKASAGSESTKTTRDFKITGNNMDEHTLTMFYMERGMWESNMMLEFNFFPVPETSVNVRKVWNVNHSSDIQPIKVQLQSKDGENSWANVGDPVTLTTANTSQSVDGKEWLYSFTGLKYNLEYRVVELDKDNNVIPNGGLTDNDLIVNYDTVTGNADDGYNQTITNKSLPEGQLRITKAIANGSTGDWTKQDKEFAIEVKFDDDGLANGTKYNVEGSDRDKVVVTNGYIYLRAGETVIINVEAGPEGKEYTVTEVDGRSSNYMASYTGTVTSGTAPTCTSTGVKGELKSGASASVTITNNQVGNQVVVIDFGIPVDISVVDNVLGVLGGKLVAVGDDNFSMGFHDSLSKTLINSDTKLPITSFEDDSLHGTASIVTETIDEETIYKLRYTPADMKMNAPDVIGYAVEYQEDGSDDKSYYHSTVTVIPATNIYYEDSFLSFTPANCANDSFGKWVEVKEQNNSTQSTQQQDRPGINSALEGLDANNIYGYDKAYDNCTTYSLGSARKVTVNAATGKPDTAPTATFSFTGTGFDVVSLTDGDSGCLWVTVKDKNQNQVKSIIVSNYYGYSIGLCDIRYYYKEVKKDDNTTECIWERVVWGKSKETSEKAFVKPANPKVGEYVEAVEIDWYVKDKAADCLYQVPVIKVEDLAYGTYDVEMKVVYLKSQDMQKAESYSVYLDAIRVYNPALGNEDAENAYKADNEFAPTYVNISDHIANGFDSFADATGGFGYVDGKDYGNSDDDKNAFITEYKNQGPNNEAYLKENDGFVFKLKYYGTDPNGGQFHVGAKLASAGSENNGSATLLVTYQMDTAWPTVKYDIKTCTSMFYKGVDLTWEAVTEEDATGKQYWETNPIYIRSTNNTNGAILSLTDLKITLPVVSASENAVSEDDLKVIVDTEAAGFVKDIWTAESNQVKSAINLTYPTLSLDGEVKYNFYYTVENIDVAVEDMGLITWSSMPEDATIVGAEDIIPGAVYNADAGEYMVRTNGIPAKKLADNLYFRVYAKLADGTYVYSPLTYYSAKFYAYERLKNSESADTKALCVALMNYGAAAQVHFGYNTENLMNAELTAEQKALVNAYSADMIDALPAFDAAKAADFVSNGGFSTGYPSVSFEGAFAINYYFVPNKTIDGDLTLYCWDLVTYNSVDKLTADNATAKIVMSQTATGEYFATYTGIAAKQIDDAVFVAGVYESEGVRYSTNVVAYSVGAYCAEKVVNGSDTMKAFAAETAVFGHYAEIYFDNLQK